MMLHNLTKEFAHIKPDDHVTIHREKKSRADIIIVTREIPEEIHGNTTQYTLVLSGEGSVGTQAVYKDMLIVVPANTPHRIVCTTGQPLKLMTIYCDDDDK